MRKEAELSNLQVKVQNLGISGNGISGNGISGNGIDCIEFSLNLEKELNQFKK
ncbi:MAG: hypothetical protein PHC34_07370 [Candidatus Gastranaerophilales bacterium]|nr:hypothetical protein [Candidatus Gastranaerophilales bacterium]